MEGLIFHHRTNTLILVGVPSAKAGAVRETQQTYAS